MPRAEQQVLINAPIERVFDVIVDYERYPEFLPEMKAVRILSRHDGGVALVRFELELIVRIQYTLRLQEDAPYALTWSLHDAKMLASMDGSWALARSPEGQTSATYGLEVKLRGMIPQSVSSRLMGTTLPQTLERFMARAEWLYESSRARSAGAPEPAS